MALQFLYDGYFAGKVGIGTETLSTKLTISGQQELLQLTRGGASDTKWFFSADAAKLYIAEDTSATANIKLTIVDTGNVGIGTITPVSTWLSGFDPSTGNGTFKLTSEGWIVTPYLTGLAGYYPGQGARPIVWADDSGTNLQCWDNSATDGVSLRSSNGTTRLFVREDGNVGIGVTAPGVKLDVAGEIRTSSNFIADNATLGSLSLRISGTETGRLDNFNSALRLINFHATSETAI